MVRISNSFSFASLFLSKLIATTTYVAVVTGCNSGCDVNNACGTDFWGCYKCCRRLGEKDPSTDINTGIAYLEERSCSYDQIYSLSLYATDHLYLFATPTDTKLVTMGDGDEIHDSFCGDMLVFHEPQTTGLGGTGGNVKDVLHLTNAVAQERFQNWQDHSFNLGSYKLQDILNAFDKEEGRVDETYDVLTSNCADLLVGMFDNLGVAIDHTMVTYVASRF